GLDDVLSGVLSRLQPAADRARAKNGYYGYTEISEVIEQVLFRSDEGAKALADIKQLARSPSKPLIYARIVANDGTSVALPLGLLDVGRDGPLGRYARILSPLRYERAPTSTGCVSRWAILANGPVGELPDRMKPAYSDWPAAKEYLQTRCEKDLAAKPAEALFILAHHPTDGGELIGFDANETTTVSGLTRCYPPGSIGFFFLCQFANPTPSQVPVTCLERFNQNGLDAAIASPFSLDEAFARHFLAALEGSVRDLSRRSSFGDLYDTTVQRLKKDFGDKDADEAFELALIGNQDLMICGSTDE
ncbi:MAG TPA: hypothetical protein VF376_12925, partial [Thermoanaerobaculia bacterium]